jgi:hypothetical protein
MAALTNFENMDPFILLSAVNMRLRDQYSSLDDLCKSEEIDKEALIKRLADTGFSYNEDQRQFR